ncbi:MAG: hypothetical protein ACTSU2_11475 [Promethearchaeota archaeon]
MGKKIKKKIAILLLFITFNSILIGSFIKINQNNTFFMKKDNSFTKDEDKTLSQDSKDGIILPKGAVSHGTIKLTSNAELDAFPDKSGSGTKENPYIIENFTFPTDVNVSIDLENIDRNLIIRNCIFSTLLNTGTIIKGIFFNNVSNLVIENSIFRDSDTSQMLYIINIQNSKDIIIQNNSFSSITAHTSYLYAIYLVTSTHNITIQNNIFEKFNSKQNIYIVHGNSVEDINIQNNIVQNCTTSMVFYCNYFETNVKNVKVINNRYLNLTALTVEGGLFKNTEDSSFSDNIIRGIYSSYFDGVYLYFSKSIIVNNNVIEKGEIQKAGNLGDFFNTNNSRIFNNTIKDITCYSPSSSIFLNEFCYSNIFYLNYIFIGVKPIIDKGYNLYTA